MEMTRWRGGYLHVVYPVAQKVLEHLSELLCRLVQLAGRKVVLLGV